MKLEHKLLSLKQVCQLYSISKSKIYRDKAAGLFPEPYKLPGNCVRWRIDELQKWESKLVSVVED